jgi:hypothetical protein
VAARSIGAAANAGDDPSRLDEWLGLLPGRLTTGADGANQLLEHPVQVGGPL